ncbi:MAG: type II secretion system secretin GspD [Candidatus Anammoxibacter sp.]
MKKLSIAVLFIIITALAGCQSLKEALRGGDQDDVFVRKPLSLSIGRDKKEEREWKIEVGTIDRVGAKAKNGNVPINEKVPDEFIFPTSTENVDSSLNPFRHKGKLIDFTFNFKDADIKDVIHQLLGEILQVNYIIDKRVAGKITVNTSGKIYKDELFAIVQSMLDINGFTVARDGKIFKIVPIQEVRQIPGGDVFIGDKVVKGGKDIITQIVPLKYITPQSVIPTLRTFLTKGGTAVAPNDTHVILVIDDASNMERLLTIIKTFDVPFFAGRALKFFDIKNLNVKNLAKHLESIAGTLGATTKGKKADLAFLPFVEANKLLVATKIPELFNTVELWIKNLDILPEEGEKVRLYVYKLQHILADQIAPILNEVFKEEIERIRKAPPAIAKKELKIIADSSTNALIIKATESDYYRISSIVDELDATPQQVLIEVVIAEVKLNENLQYGVQYFIRDRFPFLDDGSVDTTVGSQQRELNVRLDPVPTDSASLAFLTEAMGFDFLFSTIAAESTFEFLSMPHILVRDDQTATIQVGEDTPIIGGSTVVGETVTENVQYRAVGIILTVTPHIGENGMVTLDITQEDSEVAAAGIRGNPIFTTRRTETSLVVENGHTILIGGIIETREKIDITKIPILGDIPFIGNLFKSRKITKDKTELLVLITPYVVNSTSEADKLTKLFEDKLKAIGGLKRDGDDDG